MIPELRNLYGGSHEEGQEVVTPILEGKDFRLEHILSYGDVSEEGYWYDQEKDEWVVLIAGSATLEFESGDLALVAGDSILIKAHQKHRVSKTSVDAAWLALHHVG